MSLIEKKEQNTQSEELNLNKTLLIGVRLPATIVSEIDKRAEKEMRTRSNYVYKLFMESWNRMHEMEISTLSKNLNKCIVENVEN